MEYPRKSAASHPTPDPKGFLFEFLVIGMFQFTEAKYTYQLILIGGNQTGEFQINPPSHFVTFSDLKDLNDVVKQEFSKMEDEGLVQDTEMKEDPGIEEDDEMEDESSVQDAVDKVDVDNSNRKTVKKGLFSLPVARNFPAIDLIRIPLKKEYAELSQITLATKHEMTSKIDDITSALCLYLGNSVLFLSYHRN